MTKTIICASLVVLGAGGAGCTTYGADAAETPQKPSSQCNAAPVQYHIGHDATEEMGAAILAESRAKTLRWGPPNAAWTMDYRKDRVNVRYDEGKTIVEITCG